MNKKVFKIAFIFFALLSFFVMLYHAKGFFYPTTITPAWRDGVFVLINIICIYGCLKTPKWFIWFIGMLTLQQWYSHGGYALRLWQAQHIIHWPSIAVIIFLPILFVLLLVQKKK